MNQMNSCLRTRREDVSDSRTLHVLECIEKDLTAGVKHPGCSLTLLASLSDLTADGPEDDRELAVWLLPVPPPDDWTCPYDDLLFFSSTLAERCGGLFAPLPFDPLLIQATPESAPNLDWDRKGFRLYSIVPPHEVNCIYPLVRAFLAEYRATDDVSLTIRTSAEHGRVVEAVELAHEEISIPKTHRPRLDVMVGPWRAVEHAMLHVWGDACLLPWSGTGAPVEVLYGMAAGNLVCATDWLAGGVLTPKTGTLLNYELQEAPSGYLSAIPDWEQVAAVVRLAVGNGKRVLHPARAEANLRSYQNSGFSRFLLSSQQPADD